LGVVSLERELCDGATITFDIREQGAPPSCTGGSAIGLSATDAWAEPLSVMALTYAQSASLANAKASGGDLQEEKQAHRKDGRHVGVPTFVAGIARGY
jgi:hypothetical protein